MTGWTPARAATPTPDPLDVDALAARLHRTGRREQCSLRLLERWLDEHGPGYVAWSGGKDSTLTAHLAHQVRPGIPIVHYESGLDFPETVEYLPRIAREQGWNFHSVRTGDALAEMARNGSWGHEAEPADADYWSATIAGPAAEARRRFGDVMIWGLRGQESRRRQAMLASTRGVRHRSDGVVTLAPVWWWTRGDVLAALHAAGIPLNPLYARLAELGVPEREQRVSLAVGADGKRHGRLVWLRRGWPDLWARYQQALPRLREMS